MKTANHLLMASILLIGLGLSAVIANDVGDSETGIEPKADQTFKRMSEYLAGVERFSFRARDMVDQVLESGHRVQLSAVRSILLRRPNRMFAEYTGDGIHRRAWYDGKTVVLLDLKAKEYGRIDVPGSIDEMLDYCAKEFRITLPLADLMFSCAYDAVRGGIQSGRYVGLHAVRGVPCHHLTFQSGGVDWQIWIEDGNRPLPRKLVITYSNIHGAPQYIAFLDDWIVSADAPDSAFVFKIPDGMVETEFRPLVESGQKRGD